MKKRIFYILVIMTLPALIITSCKKDEGDDEPANTAPVASFTVDPTSGNTSTEFNLDASASSDQETPANELLVRWDLNNDGSWESEYSTTKLGKATFDGEGNYTIKMEVKDGGGLTATTTRDITVGGNQAPDAPANPSPEDGATNMIVLVQLQWTADDPDQDPMTFDVYFGTDQDPSMVSEGQDANSYAPGTLEYGTTYYWKVVSKDDHDHSTAGPVWSFTTGTQIFNCGSDFTDGRDGKIYGSVQIGAQCWMSENLNIGTRIDGSADMSDNSSIEKYCYDDEGANCDTYGGLYQWPEMMQYGTGTQGICPQGWHLPTQQEWEALEIELGMPVDQATATSGLQGTNEGDMLKTGGSSGFEALMGGNRSSSGAFTVGGIVTAFWSSTQSSSFNARARTLSTDYSQVNHTNYSKEYGHSVRCIKD